MNKSNNKKSIDRSNNKKAAEALYNYRPMKFGAIKFPTASKAAVYMLKRTSLSQSEIARRCGVSQPCVCQLARDVK
jgi:DNA-directed RNA polymerase specialized sigma subunit